ncbi:MAG: class I SAM-dependent methyltransferase [Actinomycetota bacterium]|nr:class I SAM-dependent methyltransferase [Actinomycetota bacterium]
MTSPRSARSDSTRSRSYSTSGAGTGVFAAAVAQCCQAVIAVDISPAMPSAARIRADQLGIEDITVVEAGFLSYDHRADAVDVVFTRHASHQLPDLWKAVALERISGLLRPGGLLYLRDLVLECEPAEIETQVEAWLAGAAGDPSVGFTARELETHLRSEFSTYSWLLDAMLAHTGFEVLDRSFRRGAYGTYACRRNAT